MNRLPCPPILSAGWMVAPPWRAWASWCVTAHRIDPGWSGRIVLEFYNGGKLPLALRPKMKIGALNFEMLSGTAARPYNKRENANTRVSKGAVASRINQD